MFFLKLISQYNLVLDICVPVSSFTGTLTTCCCCVPQKHKASRLPDSAQQGLTGEILVVSIYTAYLYTIAKHFDHGVETPSAIDPLKEPNFTHEVVNLMPPTQQ
jgi:hypothetical protein